MGNSCGRPQEKEEGRPLVLLTTFVNQFWEDNSYPEALLKLPIFDKKAYSWATQEVHTANGIEYLFTWGEGTGRGGMRPYMYPSGWVLITLVDHSYLKGDFKYIMDDYVEMLTKIKALKNLRLLVVVTPPNHPDDKGPPPTEEEMKNDAKEAFKTCPQTMEVMTPLETKEATMEEVMAIAGRWVEEMSLLRNPPKPTNDDGSKSLNVMAKMKLVAKSLPKKVLLR